MDKLRKRAIAILHIFITAFKYGHDISEGSGSLVRPPCISQGHRDLKHLQNFIHYSKKYSQLHFGKSFQSKRPFVSHNALFFIYRAPTVCRTMHHTRVFVYMNYSRQQFSDCGYSTVVLLLKKWALTQMTYNCTTLRKKNVVGFILKQLSLWNC